MRILIRIFVFSFACIWAPNVFAATYYIDFNNGNDANAGTTPTAPWKRAPGMNGFSGAYAHQVGDRIFFKGGVTWPNTTLPLIPRTGGSATAPDYYGVDSNWFFGNSWSRPVFDSQGQEVAGKNVEIDLDTNRASWITFDNIEFKGHFWTGDPGYGKNVTVAKALTSVGIVIDHCYFHGWSHAPYNAGTTPDSYNVILGSSSGDTSSSVIQNSIFDGADGDTRSGCAVKSWGIFRQNVVHDMSNAYVGSGNIINGNLIYNIRTSYDPANHENSIESWLTVNSGTTVQYIYNNIIHDVENSVYTPIAPGFGLTGAVSAYVYNNVMWNINYAIPMTIDTNCSGGTSCTPGQVAVHLWNNTLVNEQGQYCFRLINRNEGNIGTLDLRNNQCLSSGAHHYTFDAGITANTFINDHNMLMTHAEALSQGYTLDNAYKPTASNKSTVDAGVDLAAACPACPELTSDINGNPRPQGSAWDVGAYEYKIPTNIYIAQTAQGADSGSDCANAHAAAWFNAPANWGLTGAGKITPGTTMHVCGTIVALPGTAGLVVNGSGTSIQPIKILFEPDAVLQSEYFGGSTNCWSLATCNAGIEIFNHDYIIIDGGENGVIQNTANGTNLTNHHDSVGVILQGNNFIVRNLSINSIYINDPSTGTDWAGQNTANVKIQPGSTNVTVCNNHLNNARAGIASNTAGGVPPVYPLPSCDEDNFQKGANFFGNSLRDHCWQISPMGTNNSIVNIFDNDISGTTNWAYLPNQASYYHIDGIIAWGAKGEQVALNIFNNHFHDAAFGTAAVYCTYGEAGSGCKANIFNNVFEYTSNDANKTTAIWLNGSAGYLLGPNYVLNNTIMNAGTAVQLAGDFAQATIENNLISEGTTGNNYFLAKFYGTGSLPSILRQSDYNLFYGGRGFSFAGGSYWAWPDTVGSPAWTSTGFDTHSIRTDPRLDAEYHLTTGSPLIGAGINLTSLCHSLNLAPLCFDKDNIARSLTESWDIGAYQFQTNLPGDVSGDGRVTMYDAALVLKYTIGGTLTSAQQAQADVNGDTAVDAADAMAIAKKALGIN